MDEGQLRELIRESIARQMGGGEAAVRGSEAVRGSSFVAADARAGGHPSHIMLPLARGSDEADGVCFIEPSVRCNHCGYCISLGH